jgi:PAS domain S-box-containing protein
METISVLIVEDEPIIGLEIGEMLKDLGYQVTAVVDTGEKAISKTESDKPDIVLMDIRLKGETDGIDAAGIIRKRFDIPVIFSTAYLDQKRIERAKFTMPFGYVLKPIQERDLKITIEMALYVTKLDSERRKTEEILKQKEHQLLESQKVAKLGSWIWDSKNNTVEWTDETYRRFDKDPNSLIPSLEYFIERIHPNDRKNIQNVINESMENGTPYYAQARIINENGREWVMEAFGAVSRDKEGNPVGLSGTTQDITERRKVEDELEKREKILNETGQIAKIGGWELDAESLTMLWTKETHHIHEVSEDYIPPLDKAYDYYHPDDKHIVETVVQNALNNAESYDQEVRFITAKGKQLTVRIVGKPHLIDGKVVKLSGIIQDVTEQKHAKEEILRSKLLLESSIENHKGMIILSLDREYRYLYFNKAHAETMAHVYGSQPCIGDCIFDHIKGKDDKDKVKAHYDRALAGEENVVIEEYGEDPQRYYFEIQNSPIYKDKNEIIGITAFAQDVTNRKQAEEMLIKSEAFLDKTGQLSKVGGWEVEGATMKVFWTKEIYNIMEVPGDYDPSSLEEEAIAFFSADDQLWLNNVIQRSFEHGEPYYNKEFQITTAKGNKKWVCVNCEPIAAGGRVVRLSGTFQDITERKQVEEKLLRSKILLESSIESPKDMIILSLDREYRYLYFNKTHAEAMADVYGTRPQIGDCIFDYIKGKDTIEKAKAHYDRAMAGEGHVAIDELNKEQLRYYYESRYNPIHNHKKEIIGVTVFAQNITKRKLLEAALEKKTHDLSERIKELKCLYGISELVNTPGILLKGILQGVVNLIPPSWQYPDITCSRITIDDQEYKTENFKLTNWKQTAEIFVNGELHGILEIYYLAEKSELDEGPFLKEERSLINEITERLGKIIERLGQRDK